MIEDEARAEPSLVAGSAPSRDGALDASLVLLAILLSATVALFVVQRFGDAPVDPEVIKALRAPFLPMLQEFVRPEPRERLLYQLGLVYVTVVPIATYGALRWLVAQPRLLRVRRALEGRWILGVQAVAIVFFAVAWLYVITCDSEVPDAFRHLAEALGAAGLVALSSRLAVPALGRLRPVLVVATFAMVYRLSLCTDGMLDSDPGTAHHFDLLLGAINQVAHGRTILVDTSSQYGLAYPYLFALALRPFGISVGSVCALFAALGAAGVVCLYATVRRAAGPALRGTATVDLLFFGVAGASVTYFLAVLFKLEAWIYYQYFPLRTVWGCFFIWYVGTFARAEGTRRLRLGVAGYLLAGVALLWNTDTGLVVLGAWTASAAFDRVARDARTWRAVVRTCLVHGGALVATLVGTIGGYGLFALARSGHAPHYGELLRFQRNFYGAGFFMIPMKPWELWQALFLVPAVTIFLCFRRWAARTADAHVTEMLFVAIFGLGIFANYQGRSHVLNMLPVAYPTVLLGALLYLELRRRNVSPTGVLERSWIAVLSALCLLAPGWGLVNVPRGIARAREDFLVKGDPRPDAKLAAELAIVRARHGGTELPVLSEVANLVHVRTGTWSPFPVSSILEVMTTEEADRVADSARTTPPMRFVVPSRYPEWANAIPGEKVPLDVFIAEPADGAVTGPRGDRP